jgi:D-inositol-3-phosphate glycosyltransferase
VAADVGGLPTAVGDAGVLVDGHDPRRWADELEDLLLDPGRRDELARRAVRHAGQFGWERTADRLLEVYRQACVQRTSSPIGEAALLTGVPAAVVP